MRITKALTYSGFIIAAIFIIFAFITAKNYTQLAVAVVFYPVLAYFALKLFPRGAQKAVEFKIQAPVRSVTRVESLPREKVEVTDVDKRTFLKLIGAAGISFFLFSILGRRVDNLLFGKSLTSAIPQLQDTGTDTGASGNFSASGYKITEIDEGDITYYGFTNQSGGWMIMREDTENSSFRYARGNSNFAASWKDRRNLNYDYYFNLF